MDNQGQGDVPPSWQDVEVSETCPTGSGPSCQDPSLPSGCQGGIRTLERMATRCEITVVFYWL